MSVQRITVPYYCTMTFTVNFKSHQISNNPISASKELQRSGVYKDGGQDCRGNDCQRQVRNFRLLVVIDIIVFWDKLGSRCKQCSLMALLSNHTHNNKWLLTYKRFCKPLLRSYLYHFESSAIGVISWSRFMFREEDGATFRVST